MTVTTLDIDRAEQDAVAAASAHALLLAASATRTLDDDEAAQLGVAANRAAILRGRVDALRAGLRRERAAQAERDARQAAAAGDLAAVGRSLAESRTRINIAARAVLDTLATLNAAAQAHDKLLSDARDVLSGHGLTGRVRPDGSPHATTTDGPAVCLSGVWWMPVRAPEVLAIVLHRAVRDLVGHQSKLDAQLWGLTIGLRGSHGRRSDGVLDAVADGLLR